MVLLYTAKDAEEASLMVLDLRAHGVDAMSRENLGSVAFGDLPADVLRVGVHVPEQQHARARELAEAYLARAREQREQPGEAWRCAACGETNGPTFEVCWSCQAVAPEP